MVIQHNMAAMNTNRQLGISVGAGAKSTEKLSSGYRINRAGDDAAGLAISEKMRSQIRGLDRASANSQDGISLIQTAEGALNETQSILQRMRELAVQAANGTNTDSDRNEIQKEVNQLTSEINRIANTTEFNTMKLLKGNTNKAEIGGVDTTTEVQGEVGVAQGAVDNFTVDKNSVVAKDSDLKLTANTSKATGAFSDDELENVEEGVKGEEASLMVGSLRFNSIDKSAISNDKKIKLVTIDNKTTAGDEYKEGILQANDGTIYIALKKDTVKGLTTAEELMKTIENFKDTDVTADTGLNNGVKDAILSSNAATLTTLNGATGKSLNDLGLKITLPKDEATKNEILSYLPKEAGQSVESKFQGGQKETLGKYKLTLDDLFDEAGDSITIGGETFTTKENSKVNSDGTITKAPNASSKETGLGASAATVTFRLKGETTGTKSGRIIVDLNEQAISVDITAGSTVEDIAKTLKTELNKDNRENSFDGADVFYDKETGYITIASRKTGADAKINVTMSSEDHEIKLATTTTSTDAKLSYDSFKAEVPAGAGSGSAAVNVAGDANGITVTVVNGDGTSAEKFVIKSDHKLNSNLTSTTTNGTAAAAGASGTTVVDTSTTGKIVITVYSANGASSEVHTIQGTGGAVAKYDKATIDNTTTANADNKLGDLELDTSVGTGGYVKMNGQDEGKNAQAANLALAINANANLAKNYMATSDANGNIFIEEKVNRGGMGEISTKVSVEGSGGEDDSIIITNPGGLNGIEFELVTAKEGTKVKGTVTDPTKDTIGSDVIISQDADNKDKFYINLGSNVNGNKASKIQQALRDFTKSQEVTIKDGSKLNFKDFTVESTGNWDKTTTNTSHISKDWSATAGGIKEELGTYSFDLTQALGDDDQVVIAGKTFIAKTKGADISKGEIDINSTDKATQALKLKDVLAYDKDIASKYDITVNNTKITLTEKKASGVDMKEEDVSVQATGIQGQFKVDELELQKDGASITIDGQKIDFSSKNAHVGYADGTAIKVTDTVEDQKTALAAAINKNAELSKKYEASIGEDGSLMLTQKVGSEEQPEITTTSSTKGTFDVTFQVGANTGQSMTIAIGDNRANALGVSGDGTEESIMADNGATAYYTKVSNVTDGTTNDNIEYALDVTSFEKATAAIGVIDDALSSISAQRSQLGAYQNRLEHTIANLDNTSENLQSSESRIRDVDMAKEMTNFSKNNILQQAAQSMLAQANQSTQGVLTLLR